MIGIEMVDVSVEEEVLAGGSGRILREASEADEQHVTRLIRKTSCMHNPRLQRNGRAVCRSKPINNRCFL